MPYVFCWKSKIKCKMSCRKHPAILRIGSPDCSYFQISPTIFYEESVCNTRSQGRGNEGPPGRRQIVPPGALLSINVRANC